ncbi:hypothetical protein Scep_006210 [Stephania cephalantha]|uniref:TIR domain-containing protein n=1 Tax=Stephania cephalantha TaxID=152367 RepID=A0AAP0K9B9_9MAGN
MELQRETTSKLGMLSATTSRNLSSSSSAFVSASQSPFFSPRSPSFQTAESTKSDSTLNPPTGSLGVADAVNSGVVIQKPEPSSSASAFVRDNGISREKHKKGRSYGKFSFNQFCNRLRSYDVYIGFHGRKPSLLRFANWLRAELELQGMTCFAADRARCRNSRSHETVEKVMNASTYGVVIITKKSFGNPYSIEELRSFLGKKNLIPIFFDLGPGDCLARDIIERRGELWEKHGGELWIPYGGLEKEWKEAVNGLARVDEWRLEAQDGHWRDCILKAVVLLATRLSRRSVVDRVNRWRERVDREEFPFPQNENFIGRKKELSELEFILFGDVIGDAEREYFDLKTRHRRKNLVLGQKENIRLEERAKDRQTESSSSKGKEPVIWREFDKEIEMRRAGGPHRQHQPFRVRNGTRNRRKRSMKILYGKGVACVSGESGIGKTELLLEYAYRFSQRYKMVLWIGGEARYIRQNYLNLSQFLEVDVGFENQSTGKGRTQSFEEHEEDSISRVRKELMRDIPFLVVIDNLEKENDWWDKKLIMDLLPRFGGETHIIISTRLPRVMNLEPLKLSYLSGIEAMSLMRGIKDYPIEEIDALKSIEEKLGRLTLGLGIVGAILSELPINPVRLLDTLNRMPLREFSWISLSGVEDPTLRPQPFLMRLLEVCFSIFDHADGPGCLATRMVHVGGWFGPGAIPISLLASAAYKHAWKDHGFRFWSMLRAISCGLTTSHSRKSEVEAFSMLTRFGLAKVSNQEDGIHFHEMIRMYALHRGGIVGAHAMVQSVCNQPFMFQHTDHLWAACFLVFKFGTFPWTIELKVPKLVLLVKRVVLPLALHMFIRFSRCNAALELLRACTDALAAAEDSLVSRVGKWLDKPYCWGSPKSDAQLNPYLWQETVLLRATVLEARSKLMIRGGQYDIAEDLIKKTLNIRISICGEHHPDTESARETQNKITRLLTNNLVI